MNVAGEFLEDKLIHKISFEHFSITKHKKKVEEILFLRCFHLSSNVELEFLFRSSSNIPTHTATYSTLTKQLCAETF